MRLLLGGITANALRSLSSALSESLSKALSPISASNEMSRSNGSTPTLSCPWLGSRTKRVRLPSVSTIATILVLRPPRDRPMA